MPPEKKPRYFTLNAHFTRIFGRRIQKIPLDAGFGCPNRDGSLSTGGCSFCNEHGAGSGLSRTGLALTEQWDLWRGRYAQSRAATAAYIAYLQSFSNTYGPAEKLAAVLESLVVLPEIVGISIGTRPDCLDEKKIALLAAVPLPERWVELGVQSAHDKTLRSINRGHSAACSERAIMDCAAAGLNVCAHLILGLPGESREQMLDSVAWLNSLPVSGVKLHNLFVCEGTPLAELWRTGGYTPLEEHEYLELVLECLAHLRPDIVIQRLVSDTSSERLAAPAWAAMHYRMLQRINSTLTRRDLWQGKALE